MLCLDAANRALDLAKLSGKAADALDGGPSARLDTGGDQLREGLKVFEERLGGLDRLRLRDDKGLWRGRLRQSARGQRSDRRWKDDGC